MISALPLLPEAEVHQGLENIKEFVDEMPLRAVEILNNLETVYLGADGSRRRFQYSTRNVHPQTLVGQLRATNLCGGWDNNFPRLFGHSYPAIWNYIATLLEDDVVLAVIVAVLVFDDETWRLGPLEKKIPSKC